MDALLANFQLGFEIGRVCESCEYFAFGYWANYDFKAGLAAGIYRRTLPKGWLV